MFVLLACYAVSAPSALPEAVSESDFKEPAGLLVLDRLAPPVRLYLDPGHGDIRNPGNTNIQCRLEQEVMLELALQLAPMLERQGAKVTLSRQDHQKPYNERVKAANKHELLISLHSDARAGLGMHMGPNGCYQVEGAAGMAILYSDEGSPELVAKRLELARALARRMEEVGFTLYFGADYTGIYEPDLVRGVFVDRHEPRKRIKLLRRPAVPSVIIETHDAHEASEVSLWEKPKTIEAFSGAIAAALGDLD
jgi:N-acetylmuramoyl-L-alanine amidase